MVWSSHYPARCSNLVLLMHIGHSPINVCSMIFPHLWWFSSHVSSQFTTTWVSRQADVAEESAAETSAVPPAASLALPEAASASTAASSSAAAEAPGETLVAARSPAESRRSSTASVNGASAPGMAASPETKTPNLRHRKKGKNKRWNDETWR